LHKCSIQDPQVSVPIAHVTAITNFSQLHIPVIPDFFKSHDCAICTKKGLDHFYPCCLQYLSQHAGHVTLSKRKAREELLQTGFVYYDVLPANHPDVEKNFDGLPSKEVIAYMFSTNMVNGIKELCKFPIGVGYQGPLFPMNLVEHQPMLLAGELETDEKLTKWEQDMYKQYAVINEDTCPPHRMARAICHQCETKTVFVGPSVKIGSIKPPRRIKLRNLLPRSGALKWQLNNWLTSSKSITLMLPPVHPILP
jgi:hypothetical protein